MISIDRVARGGIYLEHGRPGKKMRFVNNKVTPYAFYAFPLTPYAFGFPSQLFDNNFAFIYLPAKLTDMINALDNCIADNNEYACHDNSSERKTMKQKS